MLDRAASCLPGLVRMVAIVRSIIHGRLLENTDSTEWRATRPVAIGEAVTWSYGELSTKEAVLDYGFVPEPTLHAHSVATVDVTWPGLLLLADKVSAGLPASQGGWGAGGFATSPALSVDSAQVGGVERLRGTALFWKHHTRPSVTVPPAVGMPRMLGSRERCEPQDHDRGRHPATVLLLSPREIEDCQCLDPTCRNIF